MDIPAELMDIPAELWPHVYPNERIQLQNRQNLSNAIRDQILHRARMRLLRSDPNYRTRERERQRGAGAGRGRRESPRNDDRVVPQPDPAGGDREARQLARRSREAARMRLLRSDPNYRAQERERQRVSARARRERQRNVNSIGQQPDPADADREARQRARQAACRRAKYAEAAFWLNKKRLYQHIRYVVPGGTDVEYMVQNDINRLRAEADAAKHGEYAAHPVRGANSRAGKKYQTGFVIKPHELLPRMKCPHCDADVWPSEYVQRDPRSGARLFSTCCQKGGVWRQWKFSII